MAWLVYCAAELWGRDVTGMHKGPFEHQMHAFRRWTGACMKGASPCKAGLAKTAAAANGSAASTYLQSCRPTPSLFLL